MLRISLRSLCRAPASGLVAAATVPEGTAAAALGAVAQNELVAELRVDEDERSGVQPLVPPGWTFYPPSGSNVVLRWARRVTPAPIIGTRTLRAAKPSPKTVTVVTRFRTIDYSVWNPSYDFCEVIPLELTIHNTQAPTFFMCEVLSTNKGIMIGRSSVVPVTMMDPAADETAESVHLRETWVYGGPRFPQLSNELQLAFGDYLRVIGVGPRFVEHCCQMTHYHEHQRYLMWLRQLRKFTYFGEK